MAIFKNSTHFHREWFTAYITFVCTYPCAFTLHFTYSLGTATMRTYGAIRPYLRFNESIGGFFVVEV
jgi:hypothetical protein